jgi:hypothetical protein
MRISLFLAAAVFAAPLHGEVADKSEAGFVVRGEVSIATTPLETWTTLIAPAKWWDKAHSWSGDAANLYMDAQATGCFCELLPRAKDAPEGTRRGSVEHMHVLFAEPGKLLRMSGSLGPLQGEAAHGTLTVMLKPDGAGAKLQWEYVVGGYMRMPVDQIAPAVDGVLAEQFTRLAAVLVPQVEASAKAAGKP